MEKLVIKQSRPLTMFVSTALFCLVFLSIMWLLLNLGHWNFIKNCMNRNEDSRNLWETSRGLETENEKLRGRAIKLEQLAKVDNEAAKRLQHDIRSLQDQVYRLKAELEFYQGIMSSTTNSKGLNIQGLHIEATEQERSYRFKLVLTNVAKNDRVVEATVDVSVEGVNEVGSKTLSLTDVMAGDAFNRDIKFRNFERIEGSLSFPANFKPLRVLVSLHQKNGQKIAVRRVFEWPAILVEE